MIIAFALTMPNRGSWNGRWSGEENLHVITRRNSKAYPVKRLKELNGKEFVYRWMMVGQRVSVVGK